MACLGTVVNIMYKSNCVAIETLFPFFLKFFYRICTCPSERVDSLAVARLLDGNIMGLILIAP